MPGKGGVFVFFIKNLFNAVLSESADCSVLALTRVTISRVSLEYPSSIKLFKYWFNRDSSDLRSLMLLFLLSTCCFKKEVSAVSSAGEISSSAGGASLRCRGGFFRGFCSSGDFFSWLINHIYIY